MNLSSLELAKQYAPILKMDMNEPFLPYAAGVTLFEKEAASPSFRRNIEFSSQTKLVIEYAIFWDYDIQHLYDLEHIWIYVNHEGAVYYCEASFHGKYFKGLQKDHRNLHGNHVMLFCQPGKHAFSPIVEVFDLIPKVELASNETAGCDGLLVPWLFQDEFATSPELDRKVEAYIKNRFSFTPKGQYVSYTFSDEQLISWEQLKVVIPERIREQVRVIEEWSKTE